MRDERKQSFETQEAQKVTEKRVGRDKEKEIFISGLVFLLWLVFVAFLMTYSLIVAKAN